MTGKKRTSARRPKEKKIINLALQGGGAHGAFAWGILDYLLEDGRTGFEAVTATSAGAMNACALAYGLMTGGNDGARQTLERFWNEVANEGAIYAPGDNNAFQEFWSNPFFPQAQYNQELAYQIFDAFMENVSPYQFNPLNYNPLRKILERTIDFDELVRCDCLKLFVSATNVRTGNSKIFETSEISIESVLASAALPLLFQAVEIGGEYYWDGGYMGNPSLWPLFYHAQSRDILLVHINALRAEKLPRTAPEIHDRLNEITFNSALLKELRAIAFVQKLLANDMLKEAYKKKYKDMLLHAIRADSALGHLGVASKFDTKWKFLLSLRDLGRKEAKKWIRENYESLGVRATVNIEQDYLQAPA